MSKKLEQWLDEFIENGADPADVSNWPTTAGGGASVPEYEGPYTIRENGIIDIEGKKATDDITVNVPVVPNSMDSNCVAYIWKNITDTIGVQDDLATIASIPSQNTVSVYTQSYDSDSGYYLGPSLSKAPIMNEIFLYDEFEHRVNAVHAENYSISNNNIWYCNNNQNAEIQPIYTGELDDTQYYTFRSADSYGMYRLVEESELPSFGEYFYEYHGGVITELYPAEVGAYYRGAGENVRKVSDQCALVKSGDGYYFIDAMYGSEQYAVNLPTEINATETVQYNNGTYVFTRIE